MKKEKLYYLISDRSGCEGAYKTANEAKEALANMPTSVIGGIAVIYGRAVPFSVSKSINTIVWLD